MTTCIKLIRDRDQQQASAKQGSETWVPKEVGFSQPAERPSVFSRKTLIFVTSVQFRCAGHLYDKTKQKEIPARFNLVSRKTTEGQRKSHNTGLHHLQATRNHWIDQTGNEIGKTPFMIERDQRDSYFS